MKPVADDSPLDVAARHAREFLASLDERPVAVHASVEALRAALARPLSDAGLDPETVLDDLARDADGGLLGSTTGRFFGWVIGGALPVAVAADWLATVWDQNGATYAVSPAAAVVEEIAGEWLKELLGLPRSASFGFVTGCQMAHVTALAAARHRLLAARGWDVERRGLAGSPPIRLLTSRLRHESLIRAVRLLGLGSDAIEIVPLADGAHHLSIAALAERLGEGAGAPTIVCLQAGDLNTGSFDPFEEACAVAHERNAWVHVDGAFGLWAAASPRCRHLSAGLSLADSWATDAHKWLNVPFDCGLVFVADAEAHRAALSTTASYFVAAPRSARDEMEWNPEWSRRSRGFVIYATLRSLGREGVARMIDDSCLRARQLVDGLASLADVEVLAPPVINQALVRFRAADGGHDRRTEAVIEAVRAGDETWFGGTDFDGLRAMRISVCNFRTSERDVARAVAAVREALVRTA